MLLGLELSVIQMLGQDVHRVGVDMARQHREPSVKCPVTLRSSVHEAFYIAIGSF